MNNEHREQATQQSIIVNLVHTKTSTHKHTRVDTLSKQVIETFYADDGFENWIRMMRYVVVVPMTCNWKLKKKKQLSKKAIILID